MTGTNDGFPQFDSVFRGLARALQSKSSGGMGDDGILLIHRNLGGGDGADEGFVPRAGRGNVANEAFAHLQDIVEGKSDKPEDESVERPTLEGESSEDTVVYSITKPAVGKFKAWSLSGSDVTVKRGTREVVVEMGDDESKLRSTVSFYLSDDVDIETVRVTEDNADRVVLQAQKTVEPEDAGVNFVD